MLTYAVYFADPQRNKLSRVGAMRLLTALQDVC
jgi:hypothetical protein